MTFTIHRHPLGQPLDQDACDLLAAVFVGEGFTPATQVPAGAFDPHVLATRGAAFIARSSTESADGIASRALGTLFLVQPDNRFRQIAIEGEVELHLMAVDRAQRGRGVAEALLQTCVVEARSQGALRLVLSTQVTMLAAHALYEKHGFKRNPARDWTRLEGRRFWAYELAL